MIKIINLTAHSIYDVITRNEFLPSKRIARVDVCKRTDRIKIDGSTKDITVSKTIYKDIIGLPKEKEGVMYIVSAVVLNALQHKNDNRTDIIAPGKPIKDSNGAYIGCEGFRRNG